MSQDPFVSERSGNALSPRLTFGLDYIVQGYRFHVNEGFGCTNSQIWSVLTILLLQLWNVVPPLLSIALYYRKFHSKTRRSIASSLLFMEHSQSSTNILPSEERRPLDVRQRRCRITQEPLSHTGSREHRCPCYATNRCSECRLVHHTRTTG